MFAGGAVMFSDILTLALAILGMVFILYSVMFKLVSWKEERFVFTLPLYSADNGIYERINNIRSFSELCSVNRRCSIVVINYGAPEWFCDEIREKYEWCRCVIVADGDEASEYLKNAMNGDFLQR